MTKLYYKTRSFLQYFSIAALLGCGTSSPFTLPDSFDIKFYENGGMMPYGTTIFLSNQKQSYVEFYIDGIENKIDISPNNEELNALVKYMFEQHFSKIKTREMEALDRGGNAITAHFDDQKLSISNMGFSFIRDRWKGAYSNIVERIQGIAKKQMPDKLQVVEIEMDSSLLKKDWHTSLHVNRGVFIERSFNSRQDNFQPQFQIHAMPGKNQIECYIASGNDTDPRKKTVLSQRTNILITKEIYKVKLQLAGKEIQVLYNENTKENKPAIPDLAGSEKIKIIEHQNLENFLGSNMLQINVNQTDNDPEYAPFEVDFSLKNETTGTLIPLLNTYGSFTDTYADIHYTLIETKIEEAPYLLFFSGQAGDEYNTPGHLILFDNEKKISTLQLNEGNRINAVINTIEPGVIKVKEALMCHQPIETTIQFSNKGLERIEGVFSPNTVYPNNNHIPEASHQNQYTLKSKLEVTVDGQSKTFNIGDQIQMTLQWVDFKLGIVFLTINEEKATLPLEKYKAHEFIQSMYGAKCEMG